MAEISRHTIVLIQFDQAKESRTYVDYETVPDALDGVCHLFEQSVKASKPHLASIVYTPSDLFAYIDELDDLCCLVYNPPSNSYIPHNKEWIKEQVLQHLIKKK
mmetsp:Transcript_33641/g.49869  ORF Transcript_33641/g.49869 Transcript_33641/m.49869 type:complete len:104 (+) Transcript_33641:133-444(+)